MSVSKPGITDRQEHSKNTGINLTHKHTGEIEGGNRDDTVSYHRLNTGPYDNQRQIYHSNTRLVRYSDGYCKTVSCLFTCVRFVSGRMKQLLEENHMLPQSIRFLALDEADR